MRRRYARAAMAAILLLSLGACSATTGPKQTGGTLVGAALGGLLGSKFGSGSGQLAAVAAGTLVGAFVGHGIGESLDRADQVYAQRSAHQGLETQPSGTTSGWTNPDSGHSGTFTPIRTYKSDHGGYCREYQQTVTIGGRTESAYGTACRQPDGSWEIPSAS